MKTISMMMKTSTMKISMMMKTICNRSSGLFVV
jgi:hypothetical protein